MQGTGDRLSEERTLLARQRNLLANERTFSAWLRTGLAAMVAGLGIAHVLDIGGRVWITRAIGAILILAGGAIYAIAFWRYCQECQHLARQGAAVTPPWTLGQLTAALLLVTLLALVWLVQR